MNSYAGVGTRELPESLISIINDIAVRLLKEGYILRSGGAGGSDKAFQNGVEEYCNVNNLQYSKYQEIYLPWNGFNGLRKDINKGYVLEQNPDALSYTMKYHPAANSLSSAAKTLMNRNAHQVMGKNLNDPVKFVVAITNDGSLGATTYKTGGTGQTLRIAKDLNIPIINLGHRFHLEMIKDWLYSDLLLDINEFK